jgi:hypothetical protein
VLAFEAFAVGVLLLAVFRWDGEERRGDEVPDPTPAEVVNGKPKVCG